MIADGVNLTTECVSQEELASVKGKVNQLHSHLHYWQGITIHNILQDHCLSSKVVSYILVEMSHVVTQPIIFGVFNYSWQYSM